MYRNFLCFAFASVVLAVVSSTSSAAIVLFDLAGKGGTGLLSSNENIVINSGPNPVGSGGEIGGGISLDTVSHVLTINVGWGTANGFTNLSGNATAMHIHGPTTAGSAGFLDNRPVLINLDTLPGYNNSASLGGLFNQSVTLTTAQEAQLLAGQFYINVHTSQNGGGEIRGQLVAVPEPTSFALVGLVVGGVVYRRVRRKVVC